MEPFHSYIIGVGDLEVPWHLVLIELFEGATYSRVYKLKCLTRSVGVSLSHCLCCSKSL